MSYWIALLAVCLAHPLSLLGVVNANGDYQFWQWNFIRNQISDQWAFYTCTEVRWGDNVSKAYYAYIQEQLIYTPAKWVSILPGYRQAVRRVPSDSSHWILEYVPIADLIFTAKPSDWEIRQRNRFEYILSKQSKFSWLYRNRLRFYIPRKWTSIQIRPFFDEEFFWRQGEGINEARVSVGLQETYTSHIGSEIFYMARFQKSEPHWVYQNVFNLTLIFNY